MFGFSGSEEAESSEQGARRSSGSSASDNEADESEKEYQSDDGWGAEDGFVSDSEDELVTPSQGELQLRAIYSAALTSYSECSRYVDSRSRSCFRPSNIEHSSCRVQS